MAICKIKEVTCGHILFEDGSKITFDHEQDCCEYNYADFEQLDDIARNEMFDTKNLKFELTGSYGFSFGNKNGRMFFVPCYSEQNGYYTSDVDIYFNNKCVLSLAGEFIEC